MNLADQLTDYINAAFSGLWVETREPDEAEREIVQLARQRQWKIAVWDIATGLRVPGTNGGADNGAGDPLAALRAFPALADPGGTCLLLVHNFHRFLNSPEVIQTAFRSSSVSSGGRFSSRPGGADSGRTRSCSLCSITPCRIATAGVRTGSGAIIRRIRAAAN